MDMLQFVGPCLTSQPLTSPPLYYLMTWWLRNLFVFLGQKLCGKICMNIHLTHLNFYTLFFILSFLYTWCQFCEITSFVLHLFSNPRIFVSLFYFFIENIIASNLSSFSIYCNSNLLKNWHPHDEHATLVTKSSNYGVEDPNLKKISLF